MFEIEQVPMPIKVRRKRLYPISDLRPGTDDSFFVPIDALDSKRMAIARINVLGSARYQGVKLKSMKFSEPSGLRFWRIS